jgi:hypothetical protein
MPAHHAHARTWCIGLSYLTTDITVPASTPRPRAVPCQLSAGRGACMALDRGELACRCEQGAPIRLTSAVMPPARLGENGERAEPATPRARDDRSGRGAVQRVAADELPLRQRAEVDKKAQSSRSSTTWPSGTR